MKAGDAVLIAPLTLRRTSSPAWFSVLALLAGALHAASLAWPLPTWSLLGVWQIQRGQALWWLQLAAMALLVGLLWQGRRARSAAWLGWLFALAWLTLTFGWLYTSMHTYGGLPWGLAALAVLTLAGTLALYYAAVCWLFWHLALVKRVQSAIVFAAFWTLAELARGQWLSGFGWGAAGYAQVDGPLQPLLAWVGAYGVGALAAALAALLAVALGARVPGGQRRLALGGLVALLALALWLPTVPGNASGTLRLTLLQGNIAQEEKFAATSGVPQALRWYGEQLRTAQDALVISPETALPVLPTQLPDGYWIALQQRFAHGDQAALVGLPMGDFTQGYTNSVAGFKPGQDAPWRYDKHHLVPFGEFIPPLFRWFTDLLHIPLGDFNRGAALQPTFDWQGQRLAVTICYENLFSEELARQFAEPARAPTMWVNVSNLGWFGERLAMEQHLQIARVRALEFDRPFLLATNTGRTAVVDHRGVVTHQAAPHTATALHAEVQGRGGVTPYARWAARWGQWPLWCAALGVVASAAWRRQRR